MTEPYTAGRSGGPGRPWADALRTAALAGDEPAALAVVDAALGSGMAAEAFLVEVVAAVQRQVGEAWAADRIPVAREHAATAVADRVVTAVTRHPEAHRAAPTRGRITVACVDGEWHALPARLLAEVLRLRGWRVDWLGARVPAPELIRQLHRTGPDAVALSGSLTTRLPTAHATITACRRAPVPVVAGGAAFGADGRYARLLGADAWAPDARSAADALASGPPRAPAVPHEPVARLPHLADQEYTLVARSAPQLVGAVLAGLTERLPPWGQPAAEDVARLVDSLAAGLYTDDAELLTGFTTWTAAVLGARDVPRRAPLLALDLLCAQLRDFPRATGLVSEARDAVSHSPTNPVPGSGKPGMNPSPPSPQLEVTPSAAEPRSLRIGLGGTLDRDSADLLVTAASRQLADHPGTTELRLDCADITSCDAMGLSALLMVRRLAGEAGARIRLEGGSVCLDRLLEVTGTREHLVAAPVPGAPGKGGPERPG